MIMYNVYMEIVSCQRTERSTIYMYFWFTFTVTGNNHFYLLRFIGHSFQHNLSVISCKKFINFLLEININLNLDLLLGM